MSLDSSYIRMEKLRKAVHQYYRYSWVGVGFPNIAISVRFFGISTHD